MELRGLPQSTVGWQHWSGSAGQFDAALAAAAGKNATAGAGAHAGAETVGAAAAAVARLERTLGHRIDSLEESCRNLPGMGRGSGLCPLDSDWSTIRAEPSSRQTVLTRTVNQANYIDVVHATHRRIARKCCGRWLWALLSKPCPVLIHRKSAEQHPKRESCTLLWKTVWKKSSGGGPVAS